MRTLIDSFKGCSIFRSLFNQILEEQKFQGRILDLGSGKDSTYLKFDNFKNLNIVTINMHKKTSPSIIYDLEYPFPIKDNSLDGIFAFNFLEHSYNFTRIIKESFRVIRPNGFIYFNVPFIYHYHAETNPHIGDYFRFTEMSVKKLLDDTGFTEIKITPIGRGPFTAAFSHVQFLLPRYLVPIPLSISLIVDKLIFAMSKGYYNKKPFSLGYFVEGKK